ncbi:MAG: hypothetical protein ACI81R_003183 [Bradymonadia bacterium]|jgi:hypothetical protein
MNRNVLLALTGAITFALSYVEALPDPWGGIALIAAFGAAIAFKLVPDTLVDLLTKHGDTLNAIEQQGRDSLGKLSNPDALAEALERRRALAEGQPRTDTPAPGSAIVPLLLCCLLGASGCASIQSNLPIDTIGVAATSGRETLAECEVDIDALSQEHENVCYELSLNGFEVLESCRESDAATSSQE